MGAVRRSVAIGVVEGRDEWKKQRLFKGSTTTL